MDLRGHLQQTQTQRLSPAMLRALNILQLPAVELYQLAAEEIRRNPLLDITAADAFSPIFSASGNAEDIDIGARAI